MLRSWKQTLTAGGAEAIPGQGNLPALEEELRRLRVENQRLRMGLQPAGAPLVLDRDAGGVDLPLQRLGPLGLGAGPELDGRQAERDTLSDGIVRRKPEVT